jgi:acyl carrier protein
MNLDDKRQFLKNAIVALQSTTTEFTDSTLLSDLKLDSLDVVELQIMYEDATNTVLDDPTYPIVTIGDLLQLMK